MNRSTRITRRNFVAGTASALAFTFVPYRAFGANDRIRVASIGIGGKGKGDVLDVAAAGAEIVALCDVDDNRRGGKGADVTETFPRAKYYRDFRKMLEKEEKNIDAVTVSTPDHTHFHPSIMAMQMGKHVYCQKPLTHSIWEARGMADVARKYNVATQMGNQAHAGEPIRRAVELVRAGLIGKVHEVHTWTNRPVWPQGMTTKPPKMPVPSTLSWKLWLGPAANRPYSDAYCPFNWRGWWDFGTGALGDMGCHIMDMPYWSLELKHPTRVIAESEGNTQLSGPVASTVTYTFPAGPYSNELKFVWYDGGRMPTADVLEGRSPEEAKAFDLVMIGEKGKFFFNRGNLNWQTSPASLLAECDPPKTLPRVKNEDVEWLDACRGGQPALSNFGHSGPFTEVVLLGNLAIRLAKPIEWDGERMEAHNAPEAAELIRRSYRSGWEIDV